MHAPYLSTLRANLPEKISIKYGKFASGKNYKVFVAAGGLGSRLTNGQRHGMNGRNSVFGDIIALGGGGGGSTQDTRATHAGGSGGGAVDD